MRVAGGSQTLVLVWFDLGIEMGSRVGFDLLVDGCEFAATLLFSIDALKARHRFDIREFGEWM